MTLDEMRVKLQSKLKKERFEHSVRVLEMALEMASWYGMATDKLSVAALLHDCGRVVPTAESVEKAKELGIEIDMIEEHQPILLHQKLGVYYAEKDYGVTDKEILDAIGRHSTGGTNMSNLAKIVYLADMIESGRNFEGVDELRKAAEKSLDNGMKQCYAHTVQYLLKNNLLIHPDCIDGYNELIINKEL